MTSKAEGPFGDLYTQSDYKFLAAMNDKAGWKQTPQEQSETSVILRQTYADISKEDNYRYERLIDKIEREDGVEVKHSSIEKQDRFFILESDPIDFFAVAQRERRTMIIFPPDLNMRYNSYYFYGLFFDEIPNALYGSGRDAPTSSYIRESTIVSTLGRNKQTESFDLQRFSEKEEFEEKMRNLDEIDSVRFVCDGQGVSYSLTLPNPQFAGNKCVQFSFPSRMPLADDVISLFLDIHKDGWKLNGDTIDSSRSFASAINRIREELRIR